MTTPIFSQDRRWQMWSIDEIYTGPADPGEFVPNVNDAVFSWDDGLYRVMSVDNVTGLSVLEARPFNNNIVGAMQTDVLLGSGPGTDGDYYRVYINSSVSPATLAIDHRLHIYGSDASYIKVFRGTDISLTGHVISAIFSGATLISENIPLETVVTPGVVHVKTPQTAWSIENLNDGEMVTAVVYNTGNQVISIAKLIVKNSNFIRSVDTSKKYIVGIELLSDFLSNTNTNLLELPANITLQSTLLQGKVRYNDGTSLILPVDGTRFQLAGLESMTASYTGQHEELTLIYNLLPNEYSYIASQPLPNRFITEDYDVTVIESEGAYTVKLFVVPTWQQSPARWLLKFYLYDISRDTVLDVTSHIQYSTAVPAFNGTLLDVAQTIIVSLNLQDVSPSYNYYRYPQSAKITLKNSGTNSTVFSYWQVQYENAVYFGSGLFAKVAIDELDLSKTKLDLSLGLTEVDDWLHEVYFPSLPLKLASEATPPTPTHVRLVIGALVRELTIAEALLWVRTLPTTIVQGSTVLLQFFRREGLQDSELSITSMNVKI